MKRFCAIFLLIAAILGGRICTRQPDWMRTTGKPVLADSGKIVLSEGQSRDPSDPAERELSGADLIQLMCSSLDSLKAARAESEHGASAEIFSQLPAACLSDLPRFESELNSMRGIHDDQVQQVAFQTKGQPTEPGTAALSIAATHVLPRSGELISAPVHSFALHAQPIHQEPIQVGNSAPQPDGTPGATTGTVPNVGNANDVMTPQHQASQLPNMPGEAATSDPGQIDPHLAVFSRTEFPSADQCAECHQQIYDEWSVSSHAYASISPMFHVFEQKINDLSQGTVGYFCLRCHAAVATTMGLRRDQPIWDGPKVFREGVTCVVCHRVKTPYTKANGERRIEPGDINSPVYGSGDGIGVETAIKYKDFFKVTPETTQGIGLAIHRRSIEFEELSESTFCASCHQVAVQPGIKLEVVWDQYRASPAWREGTTCQDCHMGKVPGRAEGYATGPAAIVNEKVVNPERKHSNHMFFGPGYPIAHPGVFPITKEADRWHFNEWLLFDWQAGWGTEAFERAVAEGRIRPHFPPIWSLADDRMDAREIIEKNIQKINYKRDIRRQVLENGSQLDGPFFVEAPAAGQPLKFYFCLTNTNRGHNMPSGSLGAQPQIWMNVVLLGPSGETLWETGYLDTEGDLADNHSRDVLNYRVPLDTQLFNLQTKFLTTNVKGTDREMYLPVNVDIDQIPFLRPAPQPVTVINHPPFIRMEAHSLPPTAERKARFVVPAELVRQRGTYRISVRMRSRSHPVYFMRFCEATPEMMKAMNLETVDFHEQSSAFEVW